MDSTGFKFPYKMFLVSVVTALLLSFGFYHLYWTQRPMYSIGKLVSSVRAGDSVNFLRYIDLDSVYGKMYDDYVNQLVLQSDGSIRDPKWLSRKLSGKFAVSVLQSFKPNVVRVLSELTVENVSKRKPSSLSVRHKSENQHGLVSLFIRLADVIAEENDLKNLHAETIDIEVVDDVNAVGSVHFVNRDTGVPLVLRFKMTKYDGSVWKVTEITNFEEVLGRVKNNPIRIEDIF